MDIKNKINISVKSTDILEQRITYSQYGSFKGCVIIWRGHFKGEMDEDNYFERSRSKFAYIFKKRFNNSLYVYLTWDDPHGMFVYDYTLYDYVIYENKNKNADLVYIHNAASLGFPSYESFVNSKRLVNDYLDISGLNVETYSFLDEKCGIFNIPRFPYAPFIPILNIKSTTDTIMLLLENLSSQDQRKAISIILSCNIFRAYEYDEYGDIIEDIIVHGDYGIYDTIDHSHTHILLEALEEYGIIITKDNIMDMLVEGLGYLGHKEYTHDELLHNIRKYIYEYVFQNTEAYFIPAKYDKDFKNNERILHLTEATYTTKLNPSVKTYHVMNRLVKYQSYIDSVFENR